MYMRRKIDDFLTHWKESPDHRPLIVKGARQIGKTASIREFARKNYKNLIEINFIFEPQYRQITADGYSAQQIIKNMTLINPGLKLIPGETLLFFDEIQDHPDIATTLKAFQEDKRFDVICSGSLLGINYKKIETLEEDFFARSANDLVPIEVKSTNNVSKSLRSLIRSQSYPEIHYGIKLIGGNLGYAEQICSFPHFCAFLLNSFLQNHNQDYNPVFP